MVKIRLKKFCRCIARRGRSFSVTTNSHVSNRPLESISKLVKWTRKIGSKAKSICSRVYNPNYVKMGDRDDPIVPKGYIAVYVGLKQCEFQRVLVPVIYVNHPLFGELLQKGEELFGLDYPGCITIRCRISEFEHVQNRIKEDGSIRRR